MNKKYRKIVVSCFIFFIGIVCLSIDVFATNSNVNNFVFTSNSNDLENDNSLNLINIIIIVARIISLVLIICCVFIIDKIKFLLQDKKRLEKDIEKSKDEIDQINDKIKNVVKKVIKFIIICLVLNAIAYIFQCLIPVEQQLLNERNL